MKLVDIVQQMIINDKILSNDLKKMKDTNVSDEDYELIERIRDKLNSLIDIIIQVLDKNKGLIDTFTEDDFKKSITRYNLLIEFLHKYIDINSMFTLDLNLRCAPDYSEDISDKKIRDVRGYKFGKSESYNELIDKMIKIIDDNLQNNSYIYNITIQGFTFHNIEKISHIEQEKAGISQFITDGYNIFDGISLYNQMGVEVGRIDFANLENEYSDYTVQFFFEVIHRSTNSWDRYAEADFNIYTKKVLKPTRKTKREDEMGDGWSIADTNEYYGYARDYDGDWD